MGRIALDIPTGNSRDDIKGREKIIKDFYARWIADHPSKAIWNKSINQYIKVKYLSINENLGKCRVGPVRAKKNE